MITYATVQVFHTSFTNTSDVQRCPQNIGINDFLFVPQKGLYAISSILLIILFFNSTSCILQRSDSPACSDCGNSFHSFLKLRGHDLPFFILWHYLLVDSFYLQWRKWVNQHAVLSAGSSRVMTLCSKMFPMVGMFCSLSIAFTFNEDFTLVCPDPFCLQKLHFLLFIWGNSVR